MDDMPTQEMDDDAPTEGWVVLRNCGYMHEAELIVAVLDAEGIDAFIPDAQMAGTLALTGPMGGVRVLVRESDFELADEVLTAEAAHEVPDDSPPPDDAS